MCAMQAENRGFTSVITMALPISTEAVTLRDRARNALHTLVQRAQEEGVLREDFTPEDIPLLLMANAGVLRITREVAPHAWRRLVAYQLQAYQVRSGGCGPLPAAPTRVQMNRIMLARRARAAQIEPGCPQA
jgi:hypothetical protein